MEAIKIKERPIDPRRLIKQITGRVKLKGSEEKQAQSRDANAPQRYAVKQYEKAFKRGLNQADVSTREAVKKRLSSSTKKKKQLQQLQAKRHMQAKSAAKSYAEKGKKRLQIERAKATRYKVQSVRSAELRGNAARSTPSRLRITQRGPNQVKRRFQMDRATVGTRRNNILKTRQRSLKSFLEGSKGKLPFQKKAAAKAEQWGRDQLVKQAKSAAKNAKNLTRKMAELAAKATKVVVQTVLSMVGGSGLIILLVIFGFIGAVVNSPLGIFFSGQDDNSLTLDQARAEINAEYDSKIQSIINSVSHDRLEMNYPGSPDNVRIDNWPDVVAVFATRTASNDSEGMDVVTLDSARMQKLREVFFVMNKIEHTTETVPASDPDEPEEKVLIITVTTKTATEQASAYGFNDEKMEFLDLILNDSENHAMLLVLLGYATGGGHGIDAAILQEIINNYDPDDIGGIIVAAAATRLGDPYSIPKAGFDKYIDCSLLVQYAYSAVGITMPPNAGDQAKHCADNGMGIDISELQPGDLIFWSYGPSDRYLNIGHVGIYAGDGMVIHASSVDMKVVCEPLFHSGNQVMYGHPW